MSVSHHFNRTWRRDAGGEKSYLTPVTAADKETVLSVAVPGESTDLEVVIAIDYSQIKAILIGSDQDLTIKTNSDSAPDQTFTLKANAPLFWTADDPVANPITADVTALYVTNAGSAAATLDICVLEDATP